MQAIKYFTFFLSLTVWSQTTIETRFIDKTKTSVDQFVSIDNFNQRYFIADNEIILQARYGNLAYSNMQLGTIYSANAFNPLKINVFYKDFNSAVILDNRLAEITKINFNELQPQRIISDITTAHNNNIWLFNENTRQVELFDFVSYKTSHSSLPLLGEIKDITSDYNTCWVLTDQYIYSINYFGSIIEKTKNQGFTKLKNSNGNLILQDGNSLFFLSKNSNEIKSISLPELLIKQFFVTNETLYIYDHDFLYRYQLISN